MTWIAFASVPAMLVVMLAMGQLEARLLPRNPPPSAYRDRIRLDSALHWEIPAAVADRAAAKGRQAAGRTAAEGGTVVESREEADA